MINKMEGHRINVNVTQAEQPPDETLEGSRPRAGTMGEVTSQSPRQNRRRQQPFYGQGKAISIVNVSQLEGGGYSIQTREIFPQVPYKLSFSSEISYTFVLFLQKIRYLIWNYLNEYFIVQEELLFAEFNVFFCFQIVL